LIADLSYAEQQKLRTSYYRQNTAPQLFFNENGKPISGVLFDITHAVSQKINMKLEMLPIPRKRIEQSLQRNIIDMHCVANPKWYKTNTYRWSSVLYKSPDILINRKGITSLTELSQYNNLKIGTTLGYTYPELTTYITNKNVIPISSLSPNDSYEKYRKNKISGFISASIEASYFSKELEDSVIPLNNNNIHCVYSPGLDKLTVENINAAIKSLKISGEIEAILSKYKTIPKPIIRYGEIVSD
jgi:ABC-type amino acid transport substrate-binding protein